LPKVDIGGGIELAYEEHGSGDEIVITGQMGFPSPPSYPTVLAAPPLGAHVYAVTLRGFGDSSREAEDLGLGWLDVWADDIDAFARTLGIDSYIYTGASHGSGVGWYLCDKHPARLKGFVGVVGGPHDREDDVSSSVTRREVNDAWPDPAKLREVGERLLFGPLLHPERAATRARRLDEFVEEYLKMDPAEARINQGKPFPDATTDAELAARLREIRVPTLLLSAMQDIIISPEASLRAVVNVPYAKAVFWQDEGHMIFEEAPERLAREVATWVKELNA
jgi:pimeloyl-ACP methyl ester carboxylesterase